MWEDGASFALCCISGAPLPFGPTVLIAAVGSFDEQARHSGWFPSLAWCTLTIEVLFIYGYVIVCTTGIM